MPVPPALLYLGLDAFDPDVAQRMIEAGRLPAIGSVLAAANVAPVENPVGVYVGALWPTMATSVGPGVHGRYCWGQVTPHRYDVHFMRPETMPVPPFWAELDRMGHRLAVVDVPLTPVVPMKHSVQLANYESHDAPERLASWPESLGAGVGRSFGVDCDAYAVDGRHDELVQALLAGVGAKGDLLSALAADGHDALLAVFGGSHCAGHQCWHRPSDVELVYEAIDTQVGRLLDQLPDADVVLHLSHGMTAHSGCAQVMGEVVRRISDHVAPQGASRRFVERYRQGAEYHGNRVRLQAGLGGDRSLVGLVESMHAVSVIPNNDAHAGIRFNVRGRESRGCIDADRLDDVRSAVVLHLLDVQDLDAGVPLVSAVLDTDDFHPGPCRDDLPDLLVLFHPSARGERVASEVIGEVAMPYRGNRTGDHVPEGLLAVRQRGGGRRDGGAVASVQTVDIAPTLAALLGSSLRVTGGRVRLPTP